MSDDATSERELVDGPFSTKWMAGHDKQIIRAAAKRAHRTQGEWLGEAAREKAAREREPFESHHDVLPPSHPPASLMSEATTLSIPDLAQAVDVAAQLRRLRAEQAISPRIAQGIARALEARLGITPRARRSGPQTVAMIETKD